MDVSWMTDSRPQRYGWAPGGYLFHCSSCASNGGKDRQCIGDKRAIMCADCAYALPYPTPNPSKDAVERIFAENPDKVEQAKKRPQLAGWFVGKVMQALDGKADPEYVYARVINMLELSV